MKPTRSAIPGLVLAGMLASPAAAQQVIEVEEITALATLQEIAVDRTGASVVVLDRADLQALNETRVSDILQRVPGVTIRAQGPVGTQTGLVLRGAGQNYVPVFVDGIEVSDPSGTQVAYDFGGLTSGDVGRIEILKGSQSALYGSRAVGGVISITTRRAAEMGHVFSVDTEVGAYDTTAAALSAAAKSEAGELAVTISRVVTDGFSAADENDGNIEADGFDQSRLSFYGHRDLQTGLRLGLNGFVEEGTAEFDAFGPADGPTPDNEFTDNRSRGLRAFGELSSGRVDHAFALSWFDIERESNSDFGPSLFEGGRARARYQAGVDLGSALVTLGADYTRETASDGFDFSADDSIAGLFGEVLYAPTERLDATLSLRLDDHSQFGSRGTGRLAVAYRPTPDLTLRGSLGNGYRAPSLYELYSIYGDAALEPERSLSVDLGVEQRLGEGTRLQATAFYLEVDELIDFDFAATPCGSGFGCYAQVPGTSRRQGVELLGEVQVGQRLGVTAAYTYTDSSTNASSAWARVPRHAVTLTGEAALTDRFGAAMSVAYAADRREGLGDYTVVDASANYAIRPEAEVYLRVENLFDEEYQLVPGYGTSDRAVYAGLRASF